jgi:hypothetical protein
MSNELQPKNTGHNAMPSHSPSVIPSAIPSENGWRTFGIVVITVFITVSIGYWAVSSYLFPTSFTPVVLSKKDQQRLDQKLERLGVSTGSSSSRQKPLQPEAYSESGASREINFSEKEFNALLARNTDLASKLAIDFSDNLASAKLLVNLDPDLPVLGGKTLKMTAGMEIKLSNGKPSAILKGVSVWGVPIPNAWLGNLKNTDLNKEFGQAGGFWQAINEGVEEIEVKEGKLHIKLKE